LARLAALATLVGGFVERAVIVFAGNASALRPQDYFRIAQSDTMPSGDGAAAGLSAGTVEGGRR
jgi:hypothetical protein